MIDLYVYVCDVCIVLRVIECVCERAHIFV